MMFIPVNPSFTISKWGLRGSELYRYVFVMVRIGPPHAKTCFGAYADSEAPDQPAHPGSLIRAFNVQ